MKWLGGAAAVAQVQSFTFAGTWEVGDLIRVQAGVKIWDYAVTSTTIATFLPLFVTAYGDLDAEDYPELAEMTAASTSPVLSFTANDPGKPFAITLTPLEAGGGAADAQTIEGGGVATTGTATTASAGPAHWDTAANWSGGAVPATADSVYLEDTDDDILYGFAQSGVTLALLEIRASFTGTIGLPLLNQDGSEYPEYRARHLAIGATLLNVGQGAGQGSGRLLLNQGSVQTALTVYATSSGLDEGQAALQWKGTHASNTLTAYRGEVDVARYASETAAILTLRVGYETGIDSDARVVCSTGVTLTTINQSGGDLTIASAATTVTRLGGGSLTVNGVGAYTTLTNNGGTVVYSSTGTITTYVGGPGSVIDFSRTMLARTVTTTTLNAGYSWIDSHGVVVTTNPILFNRCRVQDGNFDVGVHRSIQVS